MLCSLLREIVEAGCHSLRPFVVAWRLLLPFGPAWPSTGLKKEFAGSEQCEIEYC